MSSQPSSPVGESIPTPLVALVGRPNVGKSTLFNRLIGRRKAIVDDMPGVTRDRLFGEVIVDRPRSKQGLFRVVDTGGLQWDADAPMAEVMRQQTQMAIDEADLVFLVIDGAWGLDPVDRDIAVMLRRGNKNTVVVVNKLDHPKHDMNIADAYELGFDTVIGISADHGRGIDALRECICERLVLPDVIDPEEHRAYGEHDFDAMSDTDWDDDSDTQVESDTDLDSDSECDSDVGSELGTEADSESELDSDSAFDEEPYVYDAAAHAAASDTPPVISRIEWRGGPIHVAVVGRPNAGKSSLINYLLGEERLLATPIAGTTRDPIDTRITQDGQDYVLIDTAGVRRKRSIDERLEQITVSSSFRSMDRADVVVLVMDASEPPTDQDARIVAMAHDKGKGIVLVANKWDTMQKGEGIATSYDAVVRYMINFATYAPLLRVSAKTGSGVGALLETISHVNDECHRRIGTAELNRFFLEVVETNPPPVQVGKRPRLYYVTQPMVRPPTFIFSASRPDDIHFSYQRYLVNALRQRYGFEGTTLWLKFRSHRGNKSKTASSQRARRSSTGTKGRGIGKGKTR